ncbi:MAG: hypothetical protein ACT4P5_01185 [Armatimonadota bacterium]
MTYRAAILLLMLGAFVGCTTLRPLQTSSAAGIRQGVEAGDEVRIVTDGGVLQLSVTGVDDEGISGVTLDGRRYKVKYAAIEEISVEKFHLGRTLGVVGAVVGIAWLIWFFSVLDDAPSDPQVVRPLAQDAMAPAGPLSN